MSKVRLIRFTIFCTVFLIAVGYGSLAETSAQYPNKVIEIIIAFPPGGGADTVTRIVGKALEAKWGIPVKAVNKPGGNSVPAVVEVMRARGDGYTILADLPSSSSLMDLVVKDWGYRVMDRSFIAIATQQPMLFIVPTDSPYKTLTDAVKAIKQDPTRITWTSLGGASAQDVSFRLLFKAIGVDVTKTHAIQVKGGSAAVTLVAGGNVDVGVAAWGAVSALLSAKKLRVLAVTDKDRFPHLPDVPTTGEEGYPSVQVYSWLGFSGPPNLSSEVVEVWNKSLKEVLKEKEVLDRLFGLGVQPFYHDANGTRKFVEEEIRAIREAWGD